MQDYIEKALRHMRLRLENGSGALLTTHETKAIIAALSTTEPIELRGLDMLIARVSDDLEMLQDTNSSEATLNDIGAVLAMLQALRVRFSYLPTPAASGVSSPGGEGGGWVPVGERLPEEDADRTSDYVLVTNASGDTLVGYYRFVSRTWHEREDGRDLGNITHWQSLPTLPTHAS